MLARDRVGIGPLFYAQHDGWLLWCSEIKGLLASGMIEAEPDPRGIDYFFNFFSTAERADLLRKHPPDCRPATMRSSKTASSAFASTGTSTSPMPARRLASATRRKAPTNSKHCCAAPCGDGSPAKCPSAAISAAGSIRPSSSRSPARNAARRVDSFTIGLDRTGPLDERAKAAESARFFGSKNTVVNVSDDDICHAYPRLIAAAEGPVMDTSCAALMLLAAANRRAGNIVALTGEGADEALAGYVWFKYCRSARAGRTGSAIRSSALLRRFMLSRLIGGGSARTARRSTAANGVRFAQQISWEILAQSREQLYSADMWDRLGIVQRLRRFADACPSGMREVAPAQSVALRGATK